MAQRIPIQLIILFNDDEELDDELYVNCTSIPPFTHSSFELVIVHGWVNG